MPGYDVAPLLETRKAYLDRHTALLLGAAALALRQSGWTRETLPRERAGLMVGSAWGGVGTMTTFFRDVLTKGPKFAKPILFPHAYANTAAAMAAIEWSLQGPHEVYASGALASAQALVAAVDTVRAGEADVMLAGGCEALSSAVYLALVEQGRLVAGDAEGAPPLPFATESRCMAPGEGAAVLVLEALEAVQRRGGCVLATIVGAGLSGDGLASACAKALAEAQMPPEAVDAVFAAAGGRPDEDAAEAAALRSVFGAVCPPVTALAGLQGDCLGASMAMHAAAAVLLLRAGWLPPVPGLAASDAAALPVVRGTVRTLPRMRTALVVGRDGDGAAALLVRAV
jgi:3-oxoacyl-[acyl-carrier-protein] synthase II